MNLRGGGMSGRARLAVAVWGVGVVAAVKFLYEVLEMTGATLAVVAVLVAVGSFYGVFLPLWRRLPEDWRE